MKLRVLLIGSIAANVALAAAFVFRPALMPPAFRSVFDRSASSNPAPRVAPAAAIAPSDAIAKSFSSYWATLQSDDLRTLAAHLREAGFSTRLIRAVIVARVEAKFEGRARELTAPLVNVPYWKSDDAMFGFGAEGTMQKLSQLYRERARAVRDIIGGAELADPDDRGAALQRRQFGDLPPAKADMVQRIQDDYAELTSQVRAAMQGITLPEDREKLALLERERKADLAALLSPAELEDYQMRTARVTTMQRMALTLMDATEDEFRTIYRIQEPVLNSLYPGIATGPIDAQERRKLQQGAEDQLKAALGETRYADYARANSGDFQQLATITLRENLPLDTAVKAFALRDTVSVESQRIFSDLNLNADEKRAAFSALGQSTRAQLTATLGVTAATAYLKNANWLTQVERGASVTFGPGNSTSFRSLAQPGPGGVRPNFAAP